MTTKHRSDVRFTIETRKDNLGNLDGRMTYNVILHAVVVQGTEVCNPGYFYMSDPDYATNALNDLCITAQTESTREEMDWYGWDYRFIQPYDVKEERAAEMLKVLRGIRKYLEKVEKEFGRPETFAQFAMRVARALGATADQPFGWHDRVKSYDGTGYLWHNADGLQYKLSDTVAGKVEVTYKGRY